MATVILFHSVLGLRKVETEASSRMRIAGHTVFTPDLYGGMTTDSFDEGFEIKQFVGWETICARARAALDPLPATTVLAGHSMGAGVVGEIWPERPKCRGVVLLHGLANIPARMRKGLPIVVHIADPDPFASEEALVSWAPMARTAGASADIFTYPNAGHFYTDATLPDYNVAATEKTWAGVLVFLDSIR
ncbi:MULTISPECIES: dienelactone hydrolase family protein [Paraburkholderia]|uniref:Dienelactone hydrolase family protein n=1 Tax=Paraburkholderia metrosideri TaxID=580937 RepID=A0ABW9E6E7_9BURK